ncbi:MAG: efflux RND transporter periplasmic adaptor subunit, partial [Anaerolineales bacterium]|nr:efflux RND transporter periplasmic adaptor subunit [Anaerolineales bacterium]
AAGDVLARVDETSAQESLANAQIQLQQALYSTDPTATEAGVSLSDITVEQARLDLESMQADLEDLQNWTPDEDAVALAEANLQAAQASYYAASSQDAASTSNVTIAQIDLESAQRDLQAAQENYDAAWTVDRDWETYYNDPICDPGEQEPCTGQTWKQRIENDRSSTASALQRAQDNLAIAQATYDSTAAGVNYSSSTNAHSSVVSAEQALAAAKEGPTQDELDAAELAVRKAELAYQQALINQEAEGLSLEQAKIDVTAAENTLSDTELIAPMDGTVMDVSANVGENVGSTTFVTLADLSQPMLEVYLDETDLAMVGLDYEVDVVFDALPDETFTGKVVQVDPALVSDSGITAVRVIVQLDDFSKPQTLPVGMNATVDVIGGRAQNALLVPVEALREISTDQYAVFVMENGAPKLRMVEVGIMDFTYAEIKSGLEAGEEVTTGIIETQ